MGSKGKQEEKAEKIDEMTYNERVDIDYVINLLKTTVSVPSERLKTCSIGLEDWKGQNGIWGNRGKNCKKLYPKAWLGINKRRSGLLTFSILEGLPSGIGIRKSRRSPGLAGDAMLWTEEILWSWFWQCWEKNGNRSQALLLEWKAPD